MKLLLAFAASLLVLTTPSHADTEVYKSKDGVVLVSKKEGRNFLLEITGKEIKPMGMDSSPNPMFMVDGKFYQVAVIDLKDAKGDPSKPEAETLKEYLAYESEFYKEHLKNITPKPEKLAKDKEALGWTTDPVDVAEGAKPQTNVMLSFVHKDYIVTLGTSVDRDTPTDDSRKALIAIANTFHASDKEITLKFKEDGTYTKE